MEEKPIKTELGEIFPSYVQSFAKFEDFAKEQPSYSKDELKRIWAECNPKKKPAKTEPDSEKA